LFILNAKKRHLLLIAFSGLFLFLLVLKLYPSRFERIISYCNPWADPRGSGFQLIQSQVAFGEGGLFGVGLGESRQKLLFLPAAHTDFIFSIIAEEFGFLGVIVLLFVLFFKSLCVVGI